MSEEIRNASDEIAGAWKQVRREIRKKWGKLTNDDLDVIKGKKEHLLGKLQERYGIAQKEAEDQVKKFLQ